ncbi:hypothetical protein B0H63DRAFT_499798 [Podospora didyma]|uniref:Uncharacterized protein n=1 Tax=Podospora didyma TaxID=330526 RepID=A0AAE0NYH5_9PEZI|nr:hypothetical protein B0H63DRAFT_499798 [Podospora didyma]
MQQNPQSRDAWCLSNFYALNHLLNGAIMPSHELLKADITPVTIVEPANMVDWFLDEVRQASRRAKIGLCPLLLLVFFENGQLHKGLGIGRLKEALEPDVSVTLFTTACFSGGWAITPVLNNISTRFGSIFAEAPIAALSSVSSPLLARDVDIPDAAAGEEESNLRPEEPSEEQIATYNEFCRAITNALEDEPGSRSIVEGFEFSAQNE